MTKQEKQELLTLFVFIFVAGLVISYTIHAVKVSMIKYKYFKNGESGISHQCYAEEDKECMCLINGNFVAVDSYYRMD